MTVLLQPRLSSVARKYHSDRPAWGGMRESGQTGNNLSAGRRTKKVRPG